MHSEPNHWQKWERVAQELRAYRDEQARVWGGVDDMMIAKYLSETCTPQEHRAVEAVMQAHPEVTELIDVLRGAFEAGSLAPKHALAESIWSMQGAAYELYEQVRAWVDETGQIAVEGLVGLLRGPQPAFGKLMGPAAASTAPRAVWDLPIPGTDRRLTVSVRPHPTRNGQWELGFDFIDPKDPALAAAARVEILYPSGSRFFADRLAACKEHGVVLDDGQWLVHVSLENQGWRIPLRLGPEADAPSR